MRQAQIHRKTAETEIELFLSLDGKGESMVKTGCGFLDHMLTLFARHGRFDMELKCSGDTWVDYHHTAEDTGICLGQAFAEALGDMKGIERYGHIVLPMDEALILCAADFSGRAYLNCDVDIPTEKVGDFDTELFEEFMLAFVRHAGLTLHFKQLDGKNSHHIIEGCFKALGRTLKAAVRIEKGFENEIPSTKGMLK